MNQRQRAILRQLLANKGEPVLVQDLAVMAGCSEKTIRNDFHAIQGRLSENTSIKLVRKPGVGVFLEGNEIEEGKLFEELNSFPHINKADEGSRAVDIAFQLIMSSEPLTLEQLAAKHFVNKAVIKKDLDGIEKWLREMNLMLAARQKVGIQVTGLEKDRRKALANLPALIHSSTLNLLKEKFSSYEMDIVQTELKDLQQKYSLSFTDETMEHLLIHVLFLIKRTKLKYPITISPHEHERIKEKMEYQWAKHFLRKLEIIFIVHFPEEEIIYLALHFLGSKQRYQSDKVEHPEGPELVPFLIKKMSEATSLSFELDQALIDGLSVHITPVLNRLNYGLAVSNPMLNDIKKMYPYIFDVVMTVIDEANNVFSLQIPEEEGAYLTLHFQTSIERLQKRDGRMKEVVIVCHMGIGMSQLLRTKLERKFHSIRVIDCIGKLELLSFIKKYPVDFVISTIDLKGLKDTPYIVVSPLLDVVEEQQLGHFIEQLSRTESEVGKKSVMSAFLEPDLIFLDCNVEHPYELIEFMAEALVKRGYVGKDYPHSALSRERMSATTIGSGIAIPHGSPKMVHSSVIAAAALKKPLKWGTELVSLVFMIAIRPDEKDKTKDLFRELSELTERPEVVQAAVHEMDQKIFLEHLLKKSR
ncbi:BglG family transcription antiterminator [Falsibacillus albus]|uniref:PRD domain-containing protein n=1 Tax=Falsibacillus albus TaxID=2478915 RepID=A0A3L7JU27_9BACI|nr:BglG family transcription antiterminator [Falsibacillus albus]RLQ93795.1 PRD domain-containing protein [Falsibacillus albus]